MKVEVKEFEKVKLKQPAIIEGFPGIGMIGTIGSSFLAEKLDMKPIGYFASSHFPPIAAIHDYKPVSPARIYASEKHDLIVLFSEFVIPANIVFALSQSIISFAAAKKAKIIYSLAGVASEQPDDKVYGIASTDAVTEVLKKNGVQLIKEGATQGVSGVLIAECASQKFPAANLMVQTGTALDPRAAARLLEKLSAILEISIDPAQLVSEGEKIESRIKDAMEKVHALNQNYKGMEENPMYA